MVRSRACREKRKRNYESAAFIRWASAQPFLQKAKDIILGLPVNFFSRCRAISLSHPLLSPLFINAFFFKIIHAANKRAQRVSLSLVNFNATSCFLPSTRFKRFTLCPTREYSSRLLRRFHVRLKIVHSWPNVSHLTQSISVSFSCEYIFFDTFPSNLVREYMSNRI